MIASQELPIAYQCSSGTLTSGKIKQMSQSIYWLYQKMTTKYVFISTLLRDRDLEVREVFVDLLSLCANRYGFHIPAFGVFPITQSLDILAATTECQYTL